MPGKMRLVALVLFLLFVSLHAQGVSFLKAHVVAGQAGKDYAGQIYARRITLHQDAKFLWVIPGSQQAFASASAFNRGNNYVWFSK